MKYRKRPQFFRCFLLLFFQLFYCLYYAAGAQSFRAQRYDVLSGSAAGGESGGGLDEVRSGLRHYFAGADLFLFGKEAGLDYYLKDVLSAGFLYRDTLSPADTILIRAEDKIKRYETLKDGGDDGGESISDTLKDFVGYIILLYIACRCYGYALHLPKETDDEPEKRPVLVLPGPMTFGEIRELIREGYFDIYYTGDDE